MPSPRQYWRRYRRTRGVKRELLTLSLSLAIGLTLMPVLIWVIGSERLGPYVNGGLFALWHDYYLALYGGSLPYWLVALGPYAGVWMLRGARYRWRH